MKLQVRGCFRKTGAAPLCVFRTTIAVTVLHPREAQRHRDRL